ncbi:hypothetical protein G6F23_004893 [Rhizopus arrhizus]|nr:hypothetical protein G6F23_004893 [Rhizopus arrhizus]
MAFLSGIKKNLNRAGTTIKQKTGGTEKTFDNEYEEELERFKVLEKKSDKLSKHAKLYMDSTRAIIASQMRLLDMIEKIYGDSAFSNPVFAEYKRALENIERESKDNLDPAYQKTVMEPLARYVAYFPEVNEAIKRRNKKSLDYDTSRSKVRKLIDKPSEDPSRLSRAEQEANMARELYENLNTILISDLPRLIDLRVPYMDPIFEALVKSQQKFAQTGYEQLEGMRGAIPQEGGDGRVDQVLQQMRELTICEMPKESKKEKKVKKSEGSAEVLRFQSPIAHPLADDKLTKKLFKTVKKASKVKHVRRGVKEVAKALRKGEKGLVIIAGDISPLDVISHMPVLCEDSNVPYIFVPSKEQLGEASSTKRPTSVTMVVLGGKNKDTKAAEDYKELYDECFAQAKDLVKSII